MLAVANDEALLTLKFMDCLRISSTINSDSNKILESIQHELKAYFNNELVEFKTPITPSGTPFQKLAWEALLNIPYGATWSYAEQAQNLGRPSAVRAVANANGANPLAIIVPCHRVIQSNGKLGGYTMGTDRKEWLIKHEQGTQLIS